MHRVVVYALVIVFVFEIQTGIDARKVFVFGMLVQDKTGGQVYDFVLDVVIGRRTVDVGIREKIVVDGLFPVPAFIPFAPDVQHDFGGIGV